MALSNSTVNKLADALASDVIQYIEKDDRYVEFLMDVIPDALKEFLGELEMDLCVELSTCIMDKIYFRRTSA